MYFDVVSTKAILHKTNSSVLFQFLIYILFHALYLWFIHEYEGQRRKGNMCYPTFPFPSVTTIFIACLSYICSSLSELQHTESNEVCMDGTSGRL